MSEIVHLASVSGGKDSTAMCLHLKEQGISYRAMNFDTGWEHADTYRYIEEYLPTVIGPIETYTGTEPALDERREAMAQELEALLGRRSLFVRWCLKKGMFPSRVRRWCTTELKFRPAIRAIRAVHAAGDLPVNVVGIRAAESPARSRLLERELDADLDCMVWRPLLAWTTEDVIAIHQRHGARPNPLYLAGADRVGCWPCIMAGKAELRMLDEPRIRVIERMEQLVGELARERRPDLARPPHMFQGNRSDRGEDGQIPTLPIRERVEWARTDHGGRQMLMPLDDDSGCMRWGMCDLPDGDALLGGEE